MKIHIRLAALLTALCVAAAPAPLTALGYDIGIGDITAASTITLARSAALTQNTLQHYDAGLQAERYIEWGADSQLTPVVMAGDRLYNGALTLNEAAARLTASGREVVAGLNGDFFTVSNGVPQSIIVSEGVIRSSDVGMSAVGFGPNGAVIGRPNLEIRLSHSGATVAIDAINKVRRDTGLYLYTPDFGDNTQTVLSGTHVILEVTGDLSIGGAVSGVVREVITGTEPAGLEKGQMCLSVTDSGPVERVSQLYIGTAVTISVSARDPRFAACPNIIGAYQPLVVSGVTQPYSEDTPAPRTAVGVRPDGSAVFYTVDGRQSAHSAGLTLNQLAERMRLLGCSDAVNLDGGGSTNMAARLPGDTGLTQLGRPSDGAPRKCASYIFFVNDSPHTGIITDLYVKPSKMTVLTGASIDLGTLSLTASDSNFHTAEAPPGLIWQSLDPSVCGIAGNTLTAIASGTARLNVYTLNSTGFGTLEVSVTDTPENIRLISQKTQREVSELTLTPGESVRISAVGVCGGEDMVSDNALFSWQVTGPDIYVTPDGVVTAGTRYGATGYLVAAMGGKTVTIPVMVGKPPSELANFESAAQTPFSAAYPGTGFSRDAGRANVKFGRFAGAFRYDLSLAGGDASSVVFPADIKLEDQPSYINFWLKGDGSGNLLNLTLTDALGQAVELTAASLSDTEYRFYSIPIADGLTGLTGFKLISSAAGGAAAGVFYLDQICAAYDSQQSVLPPAVDFTYQGSLGGGLSITGTALSAGGPVLRKEAIKVLWDGNEIPFSYDPGSGAFSATHPMPSEGFHRITVEARCPSGGYERVSKNLTQPTTLRPASFTDIDAHWGAPFIEFLDRGGAYETGAADGARPFDPDGVITRAEVAVLMARVMKLDLNEWSGVTLPYADTGDIPDWALPSVKAMYGAGVMRGGEINGILSFDPHGTFTRVYSFVLLANAFPAGMSKPQVEFPFVDAAEIPEYAASSISLLMSLQIVEGHAGDAGGHIDPYGVMTRAGLAKLLCSFY
ncbi:MAG: phosphodiester glycosidase family protein [Oscillospiraceae bacterium]|nr:phosphodiester glycosidase family protein [Oscillospiraceae bacterium]